MGRESEAYFGIFTSLRLIFSRERGPNPPPFPSRSAHANKKACFSREREISLILEPSVTIQVYFISLIQCPCIAD